jgi:hypothetical protein
MTTTVENPSGSSGVLSLDMTMSEAMAACREAGVSFSEGLAQLETAMTPAISTPCPAWCDGTHPYNGGRDSTGYRYQDRVISRGDVMLCASEQEGSPIGRVAVGYKSLYGANGLRSLATDALAIADFVEDVVDEIAGGAL